MKQEPNGSASLRLHFGDLYIVSLMNTARLNVTKGKKNMPQVTVNLSCVKPHVYMKKTCFCINHKEYLTNIILLLLQY